MLFTFYKLSTFPQHNIWYIFQPNMGKHIQQRTPGFEELEILGDFYSKIPDSEQYRKEI